MNIRYNDRCLFMGKWSKTGFSEGTQRYNPLIVKLSDF
jgi:hypothetical protein